MLLSQYGAGKRILHISVGLVVAGVAVEAVVGTTLDPSLERLLHLGLLLFATAAAFTFSRLRRGEQAAHYRETLEMRRQVERSDLRYRNLLEGAGDAIFVIDADTGQCEELNGAATLLLGYTREELGALSSRKLVPMHEQVELISLVRRVNRLGMASLDRITIKRKDGTRLMGEVNARLIDLGETRVVQAIVRDITRNWEMEEELKERHRKLFLLNGIFSRVNESLDLQTVLDVTLQETLAPFSSGGGTIHLVTENHTPLLAATHNLPGSFLPEVGRLESGEPAPCYAAVERRCHLVANREERTCAMAASAGAAGWDNVVGIPLVARQRLVGIMHLMTSGPCHETTGDTSFFSTLGSHLGIAIDHARIFAEVSGKNEELLRSHALLERSSRNLAVSQSRLERNLALGEQARTELESLDRMKNNVLSMVSHEFKTPLTGILSGVEFLLATHGTVPAEEERQVLEMVQTSGYQLDGLVSNLLKVMRLEAKQPTVTRGVLQMKEIFTPLLGQFAPLLEKRCLRVVRCELDDLPFFYGDREHLETVFAELLVNAVKFTPDGGEIHVAGRVTDRTHLAAKEELLRCFNPSFYDQMGRESFLQVEVRDSGIGIPHGERGKIFESFYELGDICHHSSGKDKFQGKGTGLGLAIVKGMVEAHGGMVWVESAPAGDGSSFFVLFPLEETSPQPSLPFAGPSGTPPPRGSEPTAFALPGAPPRGARRR